MNSNVSKIYLRPPTEHDGAAACHLISQCPPLDNNSLYCNLLQCTHFSNTSVAAVNQDKLVGFSSAYLIPEQTDTLFIWQVAVAEEARGQGLGAKMLKNILMRSQCSHVTYLKTTITESNKASWALFKSMAEKLKTPLTSSVLFDKNQHFSGNHDSEILVCIGPFPPLSASLK